jgi:hypothetical protein
MSSTVAIGSNSSYAQSPAICAKVISLTSARITVVLGKVVYRHDQRKISNTDPTLRWATTLWNPERSHLFPRAGHFEMLNVR